MNEENTTATTPQPEEDSFDNWDDIDLSDAADEEEAAPEGGEEADQQEAPQEQPPEAEAEAPAQPEEPPETFELKHLGEVKAVSRDEVITLAQKGLNYEHIRQERDNARADAKRLGEYEELLKELADQKGSSVEDFADSLRAALVAKRDNLAPEIALQKVKLDRERKAFEAERSAQQQTKQQQDAESERVRQSLLRFSKEYPDVQPGDIPPEMWQSVRDGGDLTDLYARHENKLLKGKVDELTKALETEKQNSKNKERAAGSRQSAGKGNDMDAFERAWYDGT